MKKNLVLGLTIVAFLVCGFTLVVTAEEKVDIKSLESKYEGGIPAEITIQSPLWPKPTKGAVKFNHVAHTTDLGVKCEECHHVFQDGKNTWKPGDPVKKCEECHTEATIKGEKKLSEAEQKLNLKLAFHDNCVACHKDAKKQNKESKAPVTCKECHGE